MPRFFLALAVLLLASGGCTFRGTDIRYGEEITVVQRDFGKPDVIADSSGDQVRYYSPSDRPDAEWPWDAPRIFYYIDRDLRVVFRRGKAVSAGPIPDSSAEGGLPEMCRKRFSPQ